VWVDYAEQDGQYSGIFSRRFDSAGMAQGGQFQVNTYTPYYQESPDVSCAANGQFVVVWDAYPSQDGSGIGVFAQRFASAGVSRAAPAASWTGLTITALVLLGAAVRTLRRSGRARRFD
jgi:hypothetical protein